MNSSLKNIRDLSVKIITADGSGSGVILGKGLVITNLHVISEPHKIIILNDNFSVETVPVLYKYNLDDLVLLYSPELIEYTKFTPKIFTEKDLEQTEKCHIFGFPWFSENNIPFYSKGVVSNVEENRIVISSNINNGNSGGGVFDKNYKLCGIVVSKKLKKIQTVDGGVYVKGHNENIENIIKQYKSLSVSVGHYIKIEVVKKFIKSIYNEGGNLYINNDFIELFTLVND